MRIIKFRAKAHRVNGDIWIYGDLRHLKDDVCMFKQEGYSGEQVKRDTIGQFTGLYDVNGQEIYEGDILAVTELGAQNSRKILAQIVYDEDLACFNFKASDRERCMCVSITYVAMEVIGNIYDNPDLITFKIENYGTAENKNPASAIEG